MSDEENEIDRVVETLKFSKWKDGEAMHCTIDRLADGSVYVSCADFELIFEFVDNAMQRAVQRVESEGYEQCVSR